VRYRIERILQKPATTASRLSEADRRWFSRAILTLEYLGGAEARQLLKEITDKPSTEQHVAEAAAALKRLEGK
jgi:hypothetical protein